MVVGGARPAAEATAQDPATRTDCPSFRAFAAATPELSTLASDVFLTKDIAENFGRAAATGQRLTIFAANNDGYAKVGDDSIAKLQADNALAMGCLNEFEMHIQEV
jgi:hypothetical protein